MNIKALRVGMVAIVLTLGCNRPIQPQDVKQATDYSKTSLAVLCAIQGVSLDDPTFNEICRDLLPSLSPKERKAVEANLSQVTSTRKVAPKAECK